MRFLKYIVIIIGSALIHSCTPPVPPLVETELTITLTGIEFTPLKSQPESKYYTRYTIEIIDDEGGQKNGQVVEHIVTTQDPNEGQVGTVDIKTKLYTQKYKILIWADQVASLAGADLHYNTADLSAVSLTDPYKGNDNAKDAFKGSLPLDLTPYQNQWNIKINTAIELSRPLAKFEIITTDISQYLTKIGGRSGDLTELEQLRVAVRYVTNLNCEYNLQLDVPSYAKSGLGYNGFLTPLSDTEGLVAFDYIIVNEYDTDIWVNLTFYNPAGEVINSVNEVRVALRRGKVTTIREKFLTKEFLPGIGIDPGFEEDDITHTIPDL